MFAFAFKQSETDVWIQNKFQYLSRLFMIISFIRICFIEFKQITFATLTLPLKKNDIFGET